MDYWTATKQMQNADSHKTIFWPIQMTTVSRLGMRLLGAITLWYAHTMLNKVNMLAIQEHRIPLTMEIQ